MTTGQPIRVPSDRNKYDNEFMENLRLQIKLNDANLQANRLYQNTGQLPPSVQMADTRSTSEKLADIEGLKRSIVADLKPIAEPSFAFAIIEGVLNSPLNVNNTLFRYLAQNAPIFAQQLSKKYKFGVSGDANDVMLIVQFLEDAYSQTSEKFQSIKNYINSSSNINNNVSLQDTLIREFSDWTYRLEDAQRRAQRNMPNEDRALLQNCKEMIAKIRFYLPTASQMETIMRESAYFNLSAAERADLINTGFNPINPNGAPVRREDLIRDMAEMIRKLPSISRVKTLINLINKSISQNSTTSFRSGVMNLRNLFEDWILPDNGVLTPAQDTVRQFRQAFLAPLNAQIREDERVNRVNTINQIQAMNENQERDAKAQRVYVVNPGDDPVKVQTGFQSNNMPLNQGMPRDYSSQLQGSYNDYLSQVNETTRDFSRPTYQDVSNPSESYSNQAMPSDYSSQLQGGYEDYLRSFGNYGREDEDYPDYEEGVGGRSRSLSEASYASIRNPEPISRPVVLQNYPPNLSNDTRSKLNFINAQERLQLSEMKDFARRLGGDREADRITDHDTFMNFLSNRAGRNIPGITQVIDEAHRLTRSRGSGLKKKGRGLSSDYREFGINKINHKKLDDGILTLRRGTNSNIPDMPSKRISRKLQKIIKHISGGGMPDFNDINNLDNNEKDYLHKLISKSNLTDRLSVPAPSKDQEEKDFHEFEVLKGEIMAGNDSKELVKKFKILILKLSKQNVLPKNEVSEILQDLLTLGY